ncbi:MAG: 30S ribosomal protein S1 [Candidatus Omnitrophica bacterium]|nr:30S ribosomal protein S1 [Candidatus Omnitrophota bacterium]MCG2705345.1 30S ribosomal protein S1 [Candidatus Omnitrophota bacterium]
MFWKKKEEQSETAGGEDIQKVTPEQSASMSRDEMALLYEATIKDIKEGQIVKGKIIEIRLKDVVVDIGYKSEGILPMSEFPDPSKLKIGDEIEVFLDSKENENGCIVISKQKADKLQGWERIISTCKEGDIITGRPSRKVKGGLMVDIGMEAFLPASLVSLKTYSNLDEILGQELEFKIVKINRPRKNIVLSRKDVLQQRAEESKHKLLSVLEKGHVVSGVVKNITDFGAFIDLGGLDGLLHITDMNWGRISHPSEMLAIGDKIEVVVLDFNKDTNRVSLGLKQKTANPWKEVDVKYPVGSKVKGKVVNIMPYGAFMELEKGIEGLVHISELSWTKKYSHPNELLAIGDVIETVVLDIDKDNQKISLGIKQLEADPWIDVEEKFPVGTKVKGKIRNLTDYGAFVELEEGVDGLIHISEMSWTKKISQPKEVLKKGQKIEAIVLSLDSKGRKLSLGLKQLIPDPWEKIAKTYKEGYATSGKVAKITNFGIFVELENDLEGLIHVSELAEKTQAEMEAVYKVGDKIAVKVLKLDDAQRKIALALDKK